MALRGGRGCSWRQFALAGALLLGCDASEPGRITNAISPGRAVDGVTIAPGLEVGVLYDVMSDEPELAGLLDPPWDLAIDPLSADVFVAQGQTAGGNILRINPDSLETQIPIPFAGPRIRARRHLVLRCQQSIPRDMAGFDTARRRQRPGSY